MRGVGCVPYIHIHRRESGKQAICMKQKREQHTLIIPFFFFSFSIPCNNSPFMTKQQHLSWSSCATSATSNTRRRRGSGSSQTTRSFYPLHRSITDEESYADKPSPITRFVSKLLGNSSFFLFIFISEQRQHVCCFPLQQASEHLPPLHHPPPPPTTEGVLLQLTSPIQQLQSQREGLSFLQHRLCIATTIIPPHQLTLRSLTGNKYHPPIVAIQAPVATTQLSAATKTNNVYRVVALLLHLHLYQQPTLLLSIQQLSTLLCLLQVNLNSKIKSNGSSIFWI